MPEVAPSCPVIPVGYAFLVCSESDAASRFVTAVQESGFTVQCVRDFAALREAVRERTPDIILVHSRKAFGSELALYTSLRSVLERHLVPLVVIADACTCEEEAMALSAGVDAVLVVPLHPTVLSARLHSLLRIKALHDELADANMRLQELSRIDPGTGLYNRRYFFERLEEEFERVKRHRDHLGVIMLDIDHFKDVNDTYGHLFGDVVLRQLAGVLQNTSRRIDIVARYGGEEFAFIVPATTIWAAASLAERIRRTIAEVSFEQNDAQIRITASLGVAEVRQSLATNSDNIVMFADKALLKAKAQGRNRMAVYGVYDRSAPQSGTIPPASSAQ